MRRRPPQPTQPRCSAPSARTACSPLLVNAPDDLRETLEPLTDRRVIDRCARLLRGAIVNTVASTKHALRAMPGRWPPPSSEIDTHDEAFDLITQASAPRLREAFGIGPDSAAEMMIVVADNPTRVRSEAAFATLCGACPIPVSSGVTNRHWLFSWRPPSRQRGALSHRDGPHALASTHDGLRHQLD